MIVFCILSLLQPEPGQERAVLENDGSEQAARIHHHPDGQVGTFKTLQLCLLPGDITIYDWGKDKRF